MVQVVDDPYELLDAAGPTMSVLDAARVLGMSRNAAYTDINAGVFPAKTFRVGAHHRVVTNSLRELLGKDPK